MQLSPKEIYDKLIAVGINKSRLPFVKMLVLGIFAGAFIALAGAGANVAAYWFATTKTAIGLGKVLSGAVFTVGLMMVVITGSELFTGNNLMVISLMEKKITLISMLRNWIIVYIGNLIGSLIVALLVYYGGSLGLDGGLLGQAVVNTAVAKVSLTFARALLLGICCNFLVCMAVFITTGTDSTVGKLLGVFFPIWLFVTSGFEHSVANMFFIPLGLLQAQGGVPQLNISSFLLGNLLPVTLGNIIGGSICLGLGLYLCYNKENKVRG